MRICTSSKQPIEIRKIADELRFPIRQLSEAIIYAVDNPDKVVLVEIYELEKEKECPKKEKLHELLTENVNLHFVFFSLSDLVTYAKATHDTRITYQYPVNTWGLVQILLYYKCEYITIGEPLVFQLDKLQKNLANRGVKLRVCPHSARAKVAEDVGCGVEHFFILPQHLHFYDGIIDVIDVLDNNAVREQALVNIYHSSLPYVFSMSTLIENVGTDKPAMLYDDDFMKSRLNCGQKCMESASACHKCMWHEKMLSLTKPST